MGEKRPSLKFQNNLNQNKGEQAMNTNLFKILSATKEKMTIPIHKLGDEELRRVLGGLTVNTSGSDQTGSGGNCDGTAVCTKGCYNGCGG